ncbi:MAG: PKD domain-containing protein, partial [Pseudomonadales bacterium]|nr:PKD domain-containing protein [Pseudomonadales bacterium]
LSVAIDDASDIYSVGGEILAVQSATWTDTWVKTSINGGGTNETDPNTNTVSNTVTNTQTNTNQNTTTQTGTGSLTHTQTNTNTQTDLNLAPIAAFTFTENDDGSIIITNNSTDPENAALTYEWYVDDTLVSQGITFTREFSDGDYSIKLTVSDGELSDSKIQQITVQNNNEPVIAISTTELSAGKYQLISNSTDPDGDALTYSWKINSVFVSSLQSFTHELEPGDYDVKLTVSDGIVNVTGSTIITVVENAVNQASVQAKLFDIGNDGVAKSRVKVLIDPYAQQCLTHFAASGYAQEINTLGYQTIPNLYNNNWYANVSSKLNSAQQNYNNGNYEEANNLADEVISYLSSLEAQAQSLYNDCYQIYLDNV